MIKAREEIPVTIDSDGFYSFHYTAKKRQDELFFYIVRHWGDEYTAVIIDRREAELRKARHKRYEWSGIYSSSNIITGFLGTKWTDCYD